MFVTSSDIGLIVGGAVVVVGFNLNATAFTISGAHAWAPSQCIPGHLLLSKHLVGTILSTLSDWQQLENKVENIILEGFLFSL